MSTGSTGRARHSDSRDGLVGLRHDLIPGHADDAVAVGLEPGLFGGVVLTGDERVVELGAVGFDGEVRSGQRKSGRVGMPSRIRVGWTWGGWKWARMRSWVASSSSDSVGT